MEMKKVSIIVPVYNVSSYIKQCIESILSQEFQNFELLLIDDGSTDDSLSICLKYAEADARVHVLSQKNMGPSAARNLGISNASGDYITFIDSDDFVSKSYLSDMIKYDADIVVSGLDSWYAVSDIHQIRTFDAFYDCRMDKGNLGIGIEIGEYLTLLSGPCGKLYRKSIILQNNIGFEENLRYGEDHLFNLDLLQIIESIVLLPCVNYTYTHYGKMSLTNRRVPFQEMFDYIHKTYLRRLSLISKNKLSCKYVEFVHNELIFYFWQTIYTLYLTEKDRKERRSVYYYQLSLYEKNLLFSKAKLPSMYKLEQFLFKHFSFSIADHALKYVIR